MEENKKTNDEASPLICVICGQARLIRHLFLTTRTQAMRTQAMRELAVRNTVMGIAMMVAVCIVSTPLLAQNRAAKKAAADPAKRQVFFGEQHLHTENPVDAFAMGTRNTVDDAYNFAKGLAIKKNTTGEMIQKKTPYDWCAVTDHAEYLGMMPILADKSSPLAKTPIGKLIASGDAKEGSEAFQIIISATSAGERMVAGNSGSFCWHCMAV